MANGAEFEMIEHFYVRAEPVEALRIFFQQSARE
jgi:hypothetical protein